MRQAYDYWQDQPDSIIVKQRTRLYALRITRVVSFQHNSSLNCQQLHLEFDRLSASLKCKSPSYQIRSQSHTTPPTTSTETHMPYTLVQSHYTLGCISARLAYQPVHALTPNDNATQHGLSVTDQRYPAPTQHLHTHQITPPWLQRIN